MFDLLTLVIAIVAAPLLWALQVKLSGRPFTLLSAPGGFWSNLRNELEIDKLRFGELNFLGMRPGVLWGQVGAVGGGMVIDESFNAAADLSAKQYYFMKVSGANGCTVCAAATDIPLGVLQNRPTSGQTAVVRIHGASLVNSDAALTVGLLVGPAADGQADSKVPGTDTTEYIGGLVVVASGAAGEMATALVGHTPGRAA